MTVVAAASARKRGRGFHRLVFSLMLSAGCSVGPDYVEPELPLPDSFTDRTEVPPDKDLVDIARWWESFHDPLLNELVAEALSSNLDLRIAEARIRQARAEQEITHSTFWPRFDASASYERSRTSANARFQNGSVTTSEGTIGSRTSGLFQTGFDALWEINLFGVGRAYESAADLVAAAEYARRDTLVTMIAEVAQNYLTLRGLQQELAIAEENVRAQADTLDLQRTRAQAGISSDLTVAQAQAQMSTTESRIPSLRTGIDQAIHRLSILLAMNPAALREKLFRPDLLPSGPPAVPTGLPAELVRRRPDIRQAERLLASATANVGVAVAEFFPTISLAGSFGVESIRFGSLTDHGSSFWSFGPTVNIPIFEGGRIIGNVHLQEARQEEAALEYRRVVLGALGEVENALSASAEEQRKNQLLREAVEANRKSVELAKQLNESGLTDFLNVLTAQQALFQSEDELSQSNRAVSLNLIALYKALGGGWESVDRAPIDVGKTAVSQ